MGEIPYITDYVIKLDQQFVYQLFIQLFNTAFLCFILTKLLYKPVKQFLKERKEKIINQIDSAAIQLEEAEKLKAEYEAKLKEIDSEREEILSSARSAAKQRESEIISDANKEAKIIKDRAMLDIQREQEKAKDEIRKQIIEVSALMASRFISASMNEEQQNQLLGNAIEELEDVKWLS
ncbi:MAG: F0F1 ATP synthase subunit B [Firmicutes bacterium]|nr:F0F1 ATP synthase subunit B [Bacillota bacterium]